MKTTHRFASARFAALALGVALIAPDALNPVRADTAAPACTDAAYHQLDAWIGEWDVFDTEAPSGPVQGRTIVRSIVGGCALHERYEQADGLVGDSILSYDAARRQWQQTWVTNRGSFMAIAGNAKNDGALVLEGEVHLANGTTVLQRITWTMQGTDVRESAVVSKDRGATWTPAFDVLFRTRAPSAKVNALRRPSLQ
ncbi:DUF1579 family protein [Dokdonella sp.]|uniref:DUF1579 family protein n=1 Tax=Dokdonella sp. TaxID=2291710 RepID=UPI002F412E18